jgi:hypothetical protein
MRTSYNSLNPYYFPLKTLPASTWVVFGTLTHKHPAGATEQLSRFSTLMDTLGSLNNAQGRRLHWAVRLQTGFEGGDDTRHRGAHLHLHFVLGGHKVTNGFIRPLTPVKICQFLVSQWSYGNSVIDPYDPSKNGLEYLLRTSPHDNSAHDTVKLSHALNKLLKSSPPVRDPSLVEALVELRDRGTRAWFGDEVPHWITP